jgi:hypothetical protein
MCTFLDSGSAKRSAVLTRVGYTPTTVGENARTQTHYISLDHCDIAASFTLPSDRWNGINQSAGARGSVVFKALEMGTRNIIIIMFLGSKVGLVRRADNLIAICDPIV